MMIIAYRLRLLLQDCRPLAQARSTRLFLAFPRQLYAAIDNDVQAKLQTLAVLVKTFRLCSAETDTRFPIKMKYESELH